MTPLSPTERETVISFDASPAPANVFTYSRRWQEHIEKKLGIAPYRKDPHGGREYIVPKSAISMPRAPRRYSPSTLQRMRERGRQLASSSREN
jgi:hypothetical protein